MVRKRRSRTSRTNHYHGQEGDFPWSPSYDDQDPILSRLLADLDLRCSSEKDEEEKEEEDDEQEELQQRKQQKQQKQQKQTINPFTYSFSSVNHTHNHNHTLPPSSHGPHVTSGLAIRTTTSSSYSLSPTSSFIPHDIPLLKGQSPADTPTATVITPSQSYLLHNNSESNHDKMNNEDIRDTDPDDAVAMVQAAQRRRRERKRANRRRQERRHVHHIDRSLSDHTTPMIIDSFHSIDDENDFHSEDDIEADLFHAQLQILCPWYLPRFDVTVDKRNQSGLSVCCLDSVLYERSRHEAIRRHPLADCLILDDTDTHEFIWWTIQ